MSIEEIIIRELKNSEHAVVEDNDYNMVAVVSTDYKKLAKKLTPVILKEVKECLYMASKFIMSDTDRKIFQDTVDWALSRLDSSRKNETNQ